MGRFLAPDVMVPGAGRPPALNRYTYVLNNPVRYTDPTGHWIFEEDPWTPGLFIPPLNGKPVSLKVGYDYSYHYFPERKGTYEASSLEAAALETAIGLICEPCDWAITLGYWAGGDFQLTDVLGLSPGVPFVAGRMLRNTGDIFDGALRGFNIPAVREARDKGIRFHYDRLNGGDGESGPTLLQRIFPNTEFRFARRGEKGVDVRYLGGTHPSAYPGSFWRAGSNTAEFKPNTSSGHRTFKTDIRSGRIPNDAIPVYYNPNTLTIDMGR